MARVTLNIAKAYDDGFIDDIEKRKYFQLHKNAASRTDLYCFAIALGEMEGKEPTSIQNGSSTFVRTEYLTNVEPLLSSLYFDKKLKDKLDNIDEICNRDEVYNLAEKCANTGFGILKEWTEHLDEETLFYKLISYMDKEYDNIKEDLDSLL